MVPFVKLKNDLKQRITPVNVSFGYVKITFKYLVFGESDCFYLRKLLKADVRNNNIIWSCFINKIYSVKL